MSAVWSLMFWKLVKMQGNPMLNERFCATKDKLMGLLFISLTLLKAREVPFLTRKISLSLIRNLRVRNKVLVEEIY